MMRYIDQLLQGAEVKWKTIKDVCVNICSGGTPATSNRAYYQGDILWLRTQDVNWNEVYSTDIKISEEAIKDSAAKIIPANCVIVAMYGATAAKACINKRPLATNQACCNLQVNENIALYKYVYYWFFREYRNLKSLGEGSQSNLNGGKIKAYPIPIPPLHVQQEIVRILDKFTELETELEAKLETELELRKQQYERYRDQLLSPDKGLSETEVEWKKLGEVCQFKNGFAFKSSLFKESGLPIIRIGNIIGNSISMRDMAFFDPKDYKKGKPLSYFISKGDILIAMSGATTGKIGYYDNEELAYLNQRVGKFIPNPITLNNRFLYHFLLTQSDYFYRLSLGGAQPNLSSDDLMERVLIPIPPLHVQQRIVSLLDKFHTLTTFISEGLPREIELRKQQYAYYRDQLLAFER